MINCRGRASKVRRLAELGYQSGPANMLESKIRRNMYSGITLEELLESIEVDRTRTYFVFGSREKVQEVRSKFKEADRGSPL
jgi:hypothetical protein